MERDDQAKPKKGKARRYELETGGPRIEFGTFGEGRQFNRPKLAHLAFDWQF